jgi:hypothetical protein
MAMKIRSDLDLPTLRILLDPGRASFTEAVFQVVRGRDTPYEVIRCPVPELGLPAAMTGLHPVEDRALTVPPNVLDALQRAVPGLGPSPLPPQSALWLEFPSPRGYLYVMPWERLLAPLGRSLFRLPDHLVRPQAPGQTLEVAICASAPLAKVPFVPPQIVEVLVRQYLEKTGRNVTVHVFTDENWYEQVRAVLQNFGGQTVVHEPATAARYARPERTSRVGTSAQVSNPWLLWMRDATGGKPLDFVHFVSHGYLSGGRGAIAVASSPTLNTDRRWSRFIGAVEVNSFLSQVGAWGLVLTGPAGNFSEAGLRELADCIALSRPGVTMAHRFEDDIDCTQFGWAMQTVVAPGSALDDPLPCVTCWVHPRFVDFPQEYEQDLHVNADGSSVFITEPTKTALAGSETQAWVAAATRFLETQQVRWLPDSPDVSADPAAVTALGNVAALVEKHVNRSYPSGATAQGDDA